MSTNNCYILFTRIPILLGISYNRSMKIEFMIDKEFDGMTLRDVLSRKYMMSRMMIKKVKLYGKLEVNGVHRRVIDTVSFGDTVYAEYDDDSGRLKSFTETGIPILYEDDWFAVVDKPAGIVTHPSHDHLDDSLLTLLSDEPLNPVMRLDRETSGLLAIAKNGYAHNTIVKLGTGKAYVAVVYGVFDEEEGIISKPIKRRPGSVMIRDTVPEEDPDGKSSITRYKTLYKAPSGDISLVGYRLLTGRCHQIRVHSLSEGHPLVGDGLYGPNSIDNPSDRFPVSSELDKRIGRQALHAAYLELCHPITKQKMIFRSPMPEDMRKIIGLSSEACDELLGELDGFFG